MSRSEILSGAELARIFPGDSEMAGRMRAFDWSVSELGPAQDWPENLRVAVRLCLTSRFPILIGWGSKLAILYNDACLPWLSDSRHPRALGQPGREGWSEIWDTIEPVVASVVATGKATWSVDMELSYGRKVQKEEAYMTFTCAPILAADGHTVDGVFCPCFESTGHVVGVRRLETLRKLSIRAAQARTVETACQQAVLVMRENARDIPFAAIYVIGATGAEAKLRAATLPAGMHKLPVSVSASEDDSHLPWRLALVLRTQQSAECADLAARGVSLPGGPWPEPTCQAIVLPIHAARDQLAGLLVVGVSPRRPLDPDYRRFFELVTEHLATAISDAAAYEAERQRADDLTNLEQARRVFFSNIGKEVRTPLTLLLGRLEDALRNNPQPPEHLDIAYSNGLCLLELVDTLLDSSHIEADRIEEAQVFLPEPRGDGAHPPPSSAEAGVSPRQDDTEDATIRPRARILLADGNAAMRDYIRRLLAVRHDVTAVANGIDAREAARTQPPDLVLSEAMMPGLNGFELLGELRADPRTLEVPVLLLSDRAGEEARLEGLKAGADDYLTKPVNARELTARIDAHLALARIRQQAGETVRESEERLRQMVALMPSAVYTCDTEGRITFYNRRAAQLWGREPVPDDRFCAGWRLTLIDGTPLPHDQTPMANCIREGLPINDMAIVIEQPDGARAVVSVNIAPLVDRQGRQVGAINVFEDITERKRADEALRDSAARLQVVSRRVVEVQEEERRHLARELHDEIGQVLSAISVNLHAVKGVCDAAARPRIEESIQIVDQATQQVRNLSLDLRPSMLDDLGLVATLRWYADRQAQRASFAVHFAVESSGARLPAELAVACFRVAQEALTNVERHAQARHVWVELRQDDCEVDLTIRDDGIGFDPEIARRRAARGESSGLPGILERVELLGGRADIRSQPGRETSIRVWFPIPSGPASSATDIIA